MKYLKLYEAFESETISKVFRYLSKKVNKNAVSRFRTKLLEMQEELNFPIDKIKDSNILYLNRNQALKVKNKESVNNIKDLYCLKFWFSLEDGFLGFTGTGNYETEYVENRRRRSINDEFSKQDLEYIKNELGIKTGILEPLKDYNDLKHGKLVIGIWSSDEDDIERMSLAKIWRCCFWWRA